MALITVSWLLDVILILTSCITAFYLYMTRNFKYWKKRNIEEVTPTPIVGNFIDCILQKKSPGFLLKDLYDQTKKLPFVGFYILDKPCLLINDNELVKNVLVRDFNYFVDRYGSPDGKNDRIGYANLFFIKNPAWKMLRTKLTPFFTTGKLKRMFDLILDVGKDMDTYLASLELDGKGRMIDVKELAAKYTTDMIGSIAYGLKVNSLNNPNAEFRVYGRKIFEYGTIRGMELLSVFFFPHIVRAARFKVFGKDSSDFLRNVFWQTINHRLQSKEKRNDLIDILIELKNNYGDQDIEGFKFDGDDLVAQAVIFFTGGFETTSTAISFTMYELAINPKAQDRARKEIIDALRACNGDITYEIVMSLPYLDMVIAEILRMYPVLPFLDRITTEQYKMPNSDLIVEKGTPIYISMLGIHMDPEYFPDPLTFDPERFNDENKRSRPSSVYFPFGDGPHVCIGMRMGLLQTKLALIKVLTNFELSPCKETQIPMVLNPKAATTSPLGGTIKLHMRKLDDY